MRRQLIICLLPIVYVIMELVKYIYIPMVMRYRERATVVVYNYWIKNCLKYELFDHVAKPDAYVVDFKTIPKEDIPRWKYIYYFLMVWMWFNDDYIQSFINVRGASKKERGNDYKDIFNRCHRDQDKGLYTDVPLSFIWSNLKYMENNNLMRHYTYSTSMVTFLNMGYTDMVVIKGKTYYTLRY